MNRCPVNAIKMQYDAEGFLRPVVDASLCIECGQCVNVCPLDKGCKKDENNNEPLCYAGWSKDENIRFESTSGGIFTHLAQCVLEQGGAVAGARYKADNLVEHVVIYDMAELSALRQSKYVQSEIGFVFREVERELKNEKPFLFVGTPCQCAGLRSYLGRDYDNLILCDFICRGANSPMIYLAYLRELEARYGSKIKHVWFKNKTFGWNNFATKIIFENGEEYIADRETDPFMLGYIKSHLSLYMRPSCYNCSFKGVSRPVDITLGDFWGIQPRAGDTQNGVSAVIVHSEKGRRLMEDIAPKIYFEEHSVAEVIKNNPCILKSVSVNVENRKMMYNMFGEEKSVFTEILNKFN